MDLLLFEPLFTDDITHYPDLGIAMLTATCHNQGITTIPISTQQLLISHFFNDKTESICDLIYDIIPKLSKEVSATQFPTLATIVKNISRRQFSDRLRQLYANHTSASLHNFLSYQDKEDLTLIYKEIVGLNEFCHLKLHIEDVPILNVLMEYCRQHTNSQSILGFSFYRFTIFNLKIVRKIREDLGLRTIIGGAATGHLSTTMIGQLKAESYADYLIKGEADSLLPWLIINWSAGPFLCDDFIFPLNKEHTNPKVVSRGELPYLALEELPLPHFSKTQLSNYHTPFPILPFQTSRGCYWQKCTFCSHFRGYGTRYDAMSVSKIVDSITSLRDLYDCRNFVLHDDDIHPMRAVDIATRLDNEGIRVNLAAYARPVKEFTEDKIFKVLRKGGFTSFSWGLESGSQRILNSVKKGTKANNYSKILKNSSAEGISNICWIIVGFPFETEEDFNLTVSLIEKTKEYVDVFLVSQFKLQKDSVLANDFSLSSDSIPCSTYETSYSSDEIMSDVNQAIQAKRLRALASITSSFIFNSIQLPTTNLCRLIPFMIRSNFEFFPSSPCTSVALTLLGEVKSINKSHFFIGFNGRIINLTDEELTVIINLTSCVGKGENFRDIERGLSRLVENNMVLWKKDLAFTR